ncbi:hypothetical protein AU467_21645 [Mesorhizobium loti]|uniref:Uncharacterized protein n=1 Tax=Rhizobium loti TaxID=381 RepID=A0A101KTC2_RHILI|nr:hypothetical protein AU467_21645 [Mesorhizobium loti]
MDLLSITGPFRRRQIHTLSWEMSVQVAAAQAAHTVIEADELDRIFLGPILKNSAEFGPAPL